MAKQWIGDWYTTTEATDNSKCQPITPNGTFTIKVVRTQVGFYNDPSFSNIQMKIYDSTLTNVLATSANNQSKSEISTASNAIRDIYFEFEDFVMRENESYNIVLVVNSYTGTESSHVFWVRAGATPAYEPSGYNAAEIVAMPFYIGFIGANL